MKKKNNQKDSWLFFITLLMVSIISELPVQASQSNSLTENETIIGKIISFLIPAVIGFSSNVFLDLYKRTSEKKKRLSYNVDYEKETEIIKIIDGDEIRYDSKLSSVLFTLENSGDKDIKDQYIRLRSPEETKILDVKYDPEPEREMSFRQSTDNLNSNEFAFEIGYMKPNKRIGIRLLIENPKSKIMVLEQFHKSNSDDVIFALGSGNKVDDDVDVIQRFLALVLIFFIVPIPFEIPIKLGGKSGIPYVLEGSIEIQFTIANILRMIIVLFIIREIKPFSKAVVNLANRKFLN